VNVEVPNVGVLQYLMAPLKIEAIALGMQEDDVGSSLHQLVQIEMLLRSVRLVEYDRCRDIGVAAELDDSASLLHLWLRRSHLLRG
jgi:hypothetical protein